MTVEFIESPRFPEDISFNSRGGPVYQTLISVVDSGAESRNMQWSYPRHEYDVSYGVRSLTDMEDVLKFFHVVGGQAIGFRYKDWMDYKSCDRTGTPNSSDCVIGTGDGTSTSFQIYKVYTQGGYTRSRKILKPISTSILVSVNGTNTTAFTVDSTNGYILFSVAPASSHVVKAGFEFDVPCRFDTDQLAINFDDAGVGSASIPIIEIKYTDT